jgi:hypothetical protein
MDGFIGLLLQLPHGRGGGDQLPAHSSCDNRGKTDMNWDLFELTGKMALIAAPCFSARASEFICGRGLH